MQKASAAPSIPLADRLGGALAAHFPSFVRALGNLETRVLQDEIAALKIDRPVFICGLARAGTTLLLETLAAAPEFASLSYADFPMLWTPYWSNWLRARLPRATPVAQVRAHGDRIEVTRDSPEALEEPIWMQFFPGRHVAAVDQVLRAVDVNSAFDEFYCAQVRKLLAVRGKARYLAKGNYNLARLPYLRRLFPDARFVVAVREPQAQVASLLRQDRMFTQWAQVDPRIAQQMARSGHFEFGSHKRAEQFGDAATASRIANCFAQGRSAEGYALQWASSYRWLQQQLAADVELAKATLVMRFDALCADPAARLADLFAHVDIELGSRQRLIEQIAPRIVQSAENAGVLTDAEREQAHRITFAVWRSIGQ